MKPTCIVDGCGRTQYGLDLCQAHYQQFYLYGKILPRPIKSNTRYHGAKCSVESCTRKATDKGYCYAHYQRLHRFGDLMPDKPIRVIERRGRAHEPMHR